MSKSVWEANGEAPTRLQDCEEVYAGLDLSSHLDLTAYVLIGRMKGSEVWNVVPYIFTPAEGLMDRARRDRVPYDVWHERGFIETVPGHTVDYDFVVRRIREINDGLNIVSVAFDRWRIKEFKAACDRHALDLPLVEHGQSFKSMDPALKAVEKVFLNRRARHGMHPVLTMGAAGAMVIKDQSGNISLHKVKSTARIDAFVAMTMAFHAVELEVEAKPEPQYQFFVLG
jgi:phage terminase large subunit-like protein